MKDESRWIFVIVMKFGGTSIEDAVSIERAAEIVRSRLYLRPVFVNSALGKTTRHLLAAAQLRITGTKQDAVSKLEEVERYHVDLARTLVPNFERSRTAARLKEYFDTLCRLLDDMSGLSDLPLQTQDAILAHGELMATAIMAASFQERGMDVELLDARNLIITDDRFTQANPIEEITYQRIRETVHPVVTSGRVPVIQGFIGSTVEGATTTLGFEGSDYTAALIGGALGVSDIQLWKDVGGFMTADPSVYEGACVVETLTFEEAEALSVFGAKVLHPRTVEPARSKGIPVHIYDPEQPDAPCTVIAKDAKSGTSPVQSIACKCFLCLLKLRPHRKVVLSELLKVIADFLDQKQIIPLLMMTTKDRVLLAIETPEDTQLLIDNLSHLGDVCVEMGKASVSLVGENIRKTDDFPATVLQNLGGRRVDGIFHGVSPIHFTFIVDESEVASVVAQLHAFFFEGKDS